MPNKNKSRSGKAGGGQALLDQMGFADMSAMDAMIYGDVENDEDLEAELLALQGESSPERTTRKKAAAAGNANQINQMVAESMRDIPSDEDVSDTEDPELMAELQGLTAEEDAYEASAMDINDRAPSPPKPQNLLPIISDRLENYQMALAAAKCAGDSSKARRLERGLKTLQDQLKKVKAGRVVAEDDIPPSVAVSTAPRPKPVQPTPSEPPPPVFEPTLPGAGAEPEMPPANLFESKIVTSNENGSVGPKLSEEDQKTHDLLNTRRNQYKTAAVQAKHSGDESSARKYYKTAKQFDVVIKALEEGKPIDLSQMPPAPPGMESIGNEAHVYAERMQGSANVAQAEELEALPEITQEDKSKLFHAPESASTVLEALEQRLEKYQATAQAAQDDGNNSKARRMGRIVKQYQEAIKAYKAKQPIDFEALPSPPGFPPIPVDKPASSPGDTPSESSSSQPLAPKDPSPTLPQPPAATGQMPPISVSPPQPANPVAAPRISPRGGLSRQVSATSRAESQALFLQERQLQFKKAALVAKKNGELALAKNYLRMAKGFDQMIQAAHSGLPVDMSQVPPPPGSSSIGNLEFIPANENGAPIGDREEAYKKLEQDLIQQIRTCTTNADHFTKLGDVTSASRFDKMGQNSRKDLAALKNAYKHGDPVPRFHYETRTFTLVQSCTDLGDNSLEIQLIRGLNYCLPSGYSPKDLDTYVKYEFPYPNDEPQRGETDICKHTNNPEYNQCFKLDINRKSRAFLRLLKSNKFVKCEVFYKRGFLKSDKLIGTVSIKLQPLENQCEIHDSFDLMDGRKSVGGKLEVKIRVRHPFVGKQVEEVKERWLIIDNFERKLQPPQPPQIRQKSPSRVNNSAPPSDPGSPPMQSASSASYTSMEVLKYERQLLDQQILRYKGRLTPNEEEAMKHKSELLARRVEETREALRKGGVATLKMYADMIEKSQNAYMQEARALVQAGNREKAQTCMTKKKLVEREVEAIRAKLPS